MKNDDFEVLYNKYSSELYIYALSLCKDHHLSQDLVSETFFKALLSLEYSQSYIKYWLLRVCKNLYLDHLRKNKYLQDIEISENKLLIEDNTLDRIILNEERRNEAIFVKRSVNKKLSKVILASVAIVFLILFATYFIVSPIVSSFYYNPSQKTVSKYHEDIYFDLKAFTELSLPGYAIGTAGSERLGFVVYNIYYEQVNLFNREIKDINAKIKKDMKVGSFQDFYPSTYLPFMDITLPDINRNKFTEMKNEEVVNHLRQLNPVSYVSAYVLFKEDLSVKQFDELSKKYNDKVSFRWAGVRTESEGKPVDYLSGFNPNFNDGSVSGDSADKNKYPYLQLVDYMTNDDNRYKHNGSMEMAYTKHFISLLKYANDREKAVRTLEFTISKVDYYKNALNYVEKNGVNIYGVLVYGETRDLLEFISNEKINTIEINSVLPSKYIN